MFISAAKRVFCGKEHDIVSITKAKNGFPVNGIITFSVVLNYKVMFVIFVVNITLAFSSNYKVICVGKSYLV